LEKEISLGVDNVVLRGSTIRNTESIFGLVLYCGHDSKVMMNSANAKFKFSNLEK
jgi:magnesium-transporting ATPase (P-type)